MLKTILVLLVAIIIAFAGYVALQPSEFRVARSTTIAAPAASVFGNVNDLHKWEAWSPWAKLDPNAKVGFDGATAGQGAGFTWSGNSEVGEGRMTVTESKPNEIVSIKVDFTKPFEGTSRSEFAFKPEGDKTEVTWSMSGHQNFAEKAMCIVMNGKKMIGDQLEKGLANLKAVSEKTAASVH